MKKIVDFSVKATITGLILIFFVIFSAFWYFSSGLPDFKKLNNYEPPISSRVYSKDGEIIAEYAVEKRLFIPYDSIPKEVINSFLSAEDKNFFKHPGVDAKGILRAVFNNLKNIINDERLEGASTITQQVAKNFLLTNEVTLKRTIKEAILAFRIERAYSKERILELYLNQIYLGQGTYGIAAASLEYFNKSVKELNYAEAALLAALPKAPSKYNPVRYPEEAKFRRNLVLKNLYENSYITEDQFNKIKVDDIRIKRRKIKILHEANSFTEEVRRIIKNEYGFKKLYEEGLSIKTPLNANYQKKAIKALRDGIEAYDRRHNWRGPITNKLKDKNWGEKIRNINLDPTLKWDIAEISEINETELKFITLNKVVDVINKNNLNWGLNKSDLRKNFSIGDLIFVKKKNSNWLLKQYPKVNGGIVVMDPYTGNIKALVGGFSYSSSEFNRVTQAKRQPGSAFKPIVYAAALENGYSPNSIVLDAPFVIEQGQGLKDWKPENYGKKFYGPSTLRKGVEYSRNLMTVRIAETLGLKKILSLSKKLEIYDEIPELLSVSLGSAETSLLNITSAYASFVNGGKKIKPKLINKIQDRRGKTIYNSFSDKCVGCDRFSADSNELPFIQSTEKQVLSKETAYQITSILEGVVKRGTGKKLKNLNVPLAGKTGTTNDNFDAWFIGYSSDLLVGVYIGFDNPKTLGKFETGSKAALPIFKNFIQTALFKDEFKSFNVPNGIFFAPINYDTGNKANFGDKKAIVEAFKERDINNQSDKDSFKSSNYDKLIKFRQFY